MTGSGVRVTQAAPSSLRSHVTEIEFSAEGGLVPAGRCLARQSPPIRTQPSRFPACARLFRDQSQTANIWSLWISSLKKPVVTGQHAGMTATLSSGLSLQRFVRPEHWPSRTSARYLMCFQAHLGTRENASRRSIMRRTHDAEGS